MYEYAKHCGARKFSRIRSLTSALIYLKKNPLQKKNALALARKFNFSERQTAHMIGMSLRLYRLTPPSAVLNYPAIENVMRLAQLYELGLTAFDGNARSYIKWLNTHVASLNDFKPIQVLESGIGIYVIRNELLRMEYSIV